MKVGDKIKIVWIDENDIYHVNLINCVGIVFEIRFDTHFYAKFDNGEELGFSIDDDKNNAMKYKIFYRDENLKYLLDI